MTRQSLLSGKIYFKKSKRCESLSYNAILYFGSTSLICKPTSTLREEMIFCKNPQSGFLSLCHLNSTGLSFKTLLKLLNILVVKKLRQILFLNYQLSCLILSNLRISGDDPNLFLEMF